MLSSSREVESRALEGASQGRIEADEPIYVRDPGGPLSGGHVPPLQPTARPLTQAAALAIAARDKEAEVDRREPWPAVPRLPRNRGDRRVQWLPAYDFGVAAEMAADEALADAPLPDDQLLGHRGIVALTLVAASCRRSCCTTQPSVREVQRLGPTRSSAR